MAIAMPSNPDTPETYVNDFRDMLTKDVSTGPTVTLTDVESAKRIHKYTGTLTSNVDVEVPTETNFYSVWNATTGAYTVTVTTTGGSGYAVTQAKKVDLICDGTNVVQWSAEF